MTSCSFLTQLRHANRARQTEWCNGNMLSLPYMGNELAGETGELCNVLKKLERERLGMVGSRVSLADLSDELGDVLVCLDLIAERFNIDLAEAARQKFNRTSLKYNLVTRIPENQT